MGRSKHKCKECGAELTIEYDGDGVKYPVFSCKEHGSMRNEWKAWWELYSKRWREKDYWDKSADKLSCIVGYFCYKYKEFYGYPYTFEISNPIPYRSKDFTMARRILSMFEGNANEIRTYIRWVFAKKVRNRKYPVTSMGFFATASFVNEYKHAKARSGVLKRHTPLPKDFLEWCKTNASDVMENYNLKTWNDLNGLVTYIKSYDSDGIERLVIEEAVARKMLPGKGKYRQLED